MKRIRQGWISLLILSLGLLLRLDFAKAADYRDKEVIDFSNYLTDDVFSKEELTFGGVPFYTLSIENAIPFVPNFGYPDSGIVRASNENANYYYSNSSGIPHCGGVSVRQADGDITIDYVCYQGQTGYSSNGEYILGEIVQIETELRGISTGDSMESVLGRLGISYDGIEIISTILSSGIKYVFCNLNTNELESQTWNWDDTTVSIKKDDVSIELDFVGKTLSTISYHSYSSHPSKESILSENLELPIDKLSKITDTASAVLAVFELTETMTTNQKIDPYCINLATLYAETAASKATTYPVSSEIVPINASAVSALKATAVEASEAVEEALINGGVATARYLSKTIIFTTDEQDISIQIDPDVLTTEVDKVRVETPTYAVTFKLSDLEPDLTQSLTFTAQDMGTGYAAGSSSGKATVKINLPNGRTTNSITVSLPSDSGDTTYQTVVSTDGQATASKYNPATTAMDGKINISGTYTVKSNEKDFTDIADKSAEMQKAIRYLASKGIINGTSATTFSPDGNINRAKIATLLVKALGKLDSTATASFSDVTKSNWFYTVAASSQRHKIINGYEDNTFQGMTNISKVQIVAVSSRVLKAEMGYKEPASPAIYLNIVMLLLAGRDRRLRWLPRRIWWFTARMEHSPGIKI